MNDRNWTWMMYGQSAFMHAGWTGARLMIGYQALGFTSVPVLLGLVAAAFAAPSIGAALPAGRLVDRWGGAPTAVTGSVVGVAACVASAFSPTFAVLVIATAALGLGQLLSVVGQQSFVAERSPLDRMDHAYGGMTSAISIGQLLGPIVVSYTATWGATSVSQPNFAIGQFTSAACLAIAVPLGLVLVRLSEKPAPQAARENMVIVAGRILTTTGMWRALIVSGVVVASLDLLYAFLPVWAADHQVSVLVVGWLLAFRAMVTVVSRLGLAKLVRRMGRRWLLVACLVAGALSFGALPFVGALGAIAVMLAMGFALGIPQPLTISWVVARAAARVRGSALGLRVTSNRAFQVTLPLAVGALASSLGVAGIFLGTAVALVGTAVVTLTSGATLTDSVQSELEVSR